MSELKRKQYEQLLEPLQLELVALARWVRHAGKRIVIVLEGRDTAGKGGSIKAITEHLDTRQYRVAALPKPSDREQSQWYFQRYIAYLPAAGEITLFDRSWYNRAGVERVMGFATPAQVRLFLKQAPVFEKMLTDDGILLFKYWLTCDQAQQEERFTERLEDPLKAWKLSPIDVEARRRYADYTRAREAMLEATHTEHAPWTLVDFNDQKIGRLTLIRHLLDRLPNIRVPRSRPEFPPLPGRPKRERFRVLEPIAPFPVEEDPE
ncbi:polyphosphate kinase 2 [Luteimonas sp. RD2P54]|uniref:ADP/GDP-polyphosphate phosphotransferase n=1 Tax=Luteimonas endophytica TaxID=3042023 RepID=A0ABT6J5M9_9GAMM|nr:polyphosphate kinase 2 [Luteimonas endophytica]MDH5822130.1 polyphosphate kinase 2 [Luteimonas endophytica]